MSNLVHVTRLPPSPSGVALYARDVEEAYESIGAVTVHLMPSDPRSSQSFLLAVRTWLGLRRRVPANSDTIISFELAGRGIAEMWAAWILSRSRRRVWITVHDVPTLCGAAFLSRTLDRRGARRLGLALSRTLGRAAERDLLRRAELVITLSRAGADALVRKYEMGRAVLPIPLIVRARAGGASEPRIFIPGHISDEDSVLPLMSLLPSLPAPWRLVVGAAPDNVINSLAAAAHELGVAARVELLGFVDEESLDREFERASIVVRWRYNGWISGAANYAVSGPLMTAMGRGCAIVTNDLRGAAECLEAAGVTIVGSGENGAAEMRAVVSHLVQDDASLLSSAQAGLAHVTHEHSPMSVAARLMEAMK